MTSVLFSNTQQVHHNINAINAYNRLNVNVSGMKKASEKLSSGYRINRAGDDAAGLAISEKMRSQIRGLGQAKRNAQDGISMIQTFEGAAQETHTILQRMKELATESANGTYDNATDRAAIQLEFDQLNDELNQIADTDFNGNIVLNGGEMSDGLKQVNGEFDYANKQDQIIRQAKDMLRSETEDATKALADAMKAIKNTPNDLSANGEAPEWNSVDENYYNKAMADNLWVKMGITVAADATKADTIKCTELAVTYEYNGSAWTVKEIKGNNGLDYSDKKDALTVKDANHLNADSNEGTQITTAVPNLVTGKGGFTVALADGKKDGYGNATGKVLNNAVFDATTLAKGDTITLVYTNSDNVTHAPANIGWADDTYDATGIKLGSTETSFGSGLKIKLPANETDATKTAPSTTTINDNMMTAEIAKAYETLNGLEVKLEYNENDTTKKQTLTIGGQQVEEAATAGDKSVLQIGGQKFQVATVTGKLGDGEAAGLNIYDEKGTQLLATLTFAADFAEADDGTTGIAGVVKGTIALDTSAFVDSSASIDIRVGENKALETTEKFQNTIKESQDKLSALSKIKVNDFEAAKEYLSSRNVSISDSFDNSTAHMTYTENITLQTGARTKDSVNFSFLYNADGSADMGDLKANLNLSSRADGLNTANLSLANQDDANYAIDQIDKAINKTSMVRASFGAIQNRLVLHSRSN